MSIIETITPTRDERNRAVTFEWPVTEKDGEKIVAVLRVSHQKRFHRDDVFAVSLMNETLESASTPGFSVRKFMAFSNTPLGVLPAGNRYSAKRLAQAAQDAFELLVSMKDEPRVARYFDAEQVPVNAIHDAR